MKKIIKVFLLLITIFSSLASVSIFADTKNQFSIPAKAAIAVDASGGKILYSQNATDANMGIASITKLLTIYLVYQDIQSGKLKWTDKVPISNYAYQLTQSVDASNIKFTQGEKYTVKDLVDAALLPSANSAAIALAEDVAGSEPKFVNKMRSQLKAWGVTDAKIYNASGLNNSDLPVDHRYPGSSATAENTMSAEDVAVIATHLLKDYPQILAITKQTSLVFDKGGPSKQTLNTTNYMLPGFQTSKEGVDGLKTGSTLFAGDCFVGTINENGFRVITVVLNADNGSSDPYARFTATSTLMDEVYSNWQAYKIASSDAKLKDFASLPIADGKKSAVPLITKTDFTAVLPMKSPDYSISYQKNKKNLVAPVKKGETEASAKVTVKDKLGYLPQFNGQTVSLVAQSTIKRANPFIVGWNDFVQFVNKDL